MTDDTMEVVMSKETSMTLGLNSLEGDDTKDIMMIGNSNPA